MEEAKLDIDIVHSLPDEEILETGGRITSAFTGRIADSFGTCIGCFGNIGDVRPIDWSIRWVLPATRRWGLGIFLVALRCWSLAHFLVNNERILRGLP